MLRVLHLHSSFAAGGKELRAAKLMNAFAKGVEHTVVSAVPGEMAAAAAVGKQVRVNYPNDFPPLAGKPFPRRLMTIGRAMQGFDLVLTYNWGAMDAVMAHTVFGQHLRLPPLVHHEDGFNQDEAERLKPARNWYRRVALTGAQGLVVPSQRLEHIARTAWAQPQRKVFRIANGIPLSDYGRKAKADALPRVIKHPGELWLGTLAGLRAVKNLPRLVRAFARMPEEWNLVILGEGPERATIQAEALRLDLGHRVHLPGFASDTARVLGLFDLFALSSDSEQFPISVVEAMAAGLAVVSPRVGDVEAMLAPENRRFITPAGDDAALGEALAALAADPDARRTIGAANQLKAAAEYDEAKMIAAYARVYGDAMGRRSFP